MPRKATPLKPAAKAAGRPAGLPSREQILEFVQSSADRVGKREIARAFQVKGPDRIALKRLLKEMADDGLITGPRRKIARTGTLPSVGVVEIVARDEDGELVALPASWDSDQHGTPPRILVSADARQAGPAPGVGDRLLARLVPTGETGGGAYPYRAHPIKRLARERTRLLGIFRAVKGGGGVIDPVDRKQLKEWSVVPGDEGGGTDGRARPLRAVARRALRPAARAHHRAAGRPGGPGRDQPDRHPCPWSPRQLPRPRSRRG